MYEFVAIVLSGPVCCMWATEEASLCDRMGKQGVVKVHVYGGTTSFDLHEPAQRRSITSITGRL